MIQGLIFGIIGSIIGFFKMKAVLKQCLITSNSSNSFEYKGKNYDKDKFIELRCSEYSNLNKRNLNSEIKSLKKIIDKGKEIEFHKANLEAAQLALSIRYPDSVNNSDIDVITNKPQRNTDEIAQKANKESNSDTIVDDLNSKTVKRVVKVKIQNKSTDEINSVTISNKPKKNKTTIALLITTAIFAITSIVFFCSIFGLV